MKVPTRVLIRADGTWHEFAYPLSTKEIESRLRTDALDTVSLIDGVHVMLVDDTSAMKGLKVNAIATALYMEKCGLDHHEWRIHGDVIIVPDSDFEQRRHSGVQPPEPIRY